MSDKIVVSEDDIKIFRDWLKKMPYLPQNVDDNYIKWFILGSKGSIQKAKTVYDNFYKCTGDFLPLIMDGPDIFSERLVRFDKTWFQTILPNTPEGYFLCYSRFLTTDSTDFDFKYYFLRMSLTTLTLLHGDHGTAECVFIYDISNLQASHFTSLSPVILEKLMVSVSYLPIRVKAVHCYGVSSHLMWGIGLFQKLLPDKLKQRVHFHDGPESLLKHLPKEIIPSDIGGTGDSVATWHERTMQRLRNDQKWLNEELAEHIRLYKLRPKTEDLTGTFRKLQVD